jgi:hypothetical protein
MALRLQARRRTGGSSRTAATRGVKRDGLTLQPVQIRLFPPGRKPSPHGRVFSSTPGGARWRTARRYNSALHAMFDVTCNGVAM